MFLMYSPTIAGSKQWIRMPLGRERTVSRAKTYWWTEHYEFGGVRPPASWTTVLQARRRLEAGAQRPAATAWPWTSTTKSCSTL